MPYGEHRPNGIVEPLPVGFTRHAGASSVHIVRRNDGNISMENVPMIN